MPLMIKAVKFGKLFLRTHCFQFQLPINYDTEIIKMKIYGECHDQVFKKIVNWMGLQTSDSILMLCSKIGQ